jgi:ribonuclease P protein component
LNQAYTFKKEEKISLQTEINLLFAEGESFLSYPFRVLYVRQQPASGARMAVLISVPKKKIKQAVNRNCIKRHVREAYRLNKNELTTLLAGQQTGLLIAFIFVGNTLSDHISIESSIKRTFLELKARLSCEKS